MSLLKSKILTPIVIIIVLSGAIFLFFKIKSGMEQINQPTAVYKKDLDSRKPSDSVATSAIPIMPFRVIGEIKDIASDFMVLGNLIVPQEEREKVGAINEMRIKTGDSVKVSREPAARTNLDPEREKTSLKDLAVGQNVFVGYEIQSAGPGEEAKEDKPSYIAKFITILPEPADKNKK